MSALRYEYPKKSGSRRRKIFRRRTERELSHVLGALLGGRPKLQANHARVRRLSREIAEEVAKLVGSNESDFFEIDRERARGKSGSATHTVDSR